MAEDDQLNNKELEERLARLEKKIDRLEQKLYGKSPPAHIPAEEKPAEDRYGGRSGDENSGRGIAGERQGDRYPEEKKQRAEWFDDSTEFGEKWLNRIGIGLLLLGVAFLFKYSVDQGWLLPPVRSAIGLTIGLVLFALGIRMDRENKPLKQILSGGGIAVFYMTGFATFQLYGFVPHTLVWIFMIIITLLALSISLQQNEPVLSVTGIVGALGTPFMLYTGSGTLSALIIYTALVLGAAGWIYLVKGWRSLLWSMTAGGWIVVMVGIFNTLIGESDTLSSDRWSLQAGVFICMIVFWIIPVIREILSFRNPEQWPDPLFVKERSRDENIIYITNSSVYVLALIVPLFSLVLSMTVWELPSETWGVISLASAVPIAGGYAALQRLSMQKMSSVHAFSALIMLTIGLVLLLEGDTLFLILAVEATGLRYIAHRTGDPNVSVSSHILFGIIAYWLIMLFGGTTPAEFRWDLNLLIRLVIIALGGIAVPLWLRDHGTRRIYGIAGHIFFLVWMYQLFLPFEDSQAWITIAWGIYAVALLTAGFVRFGRTLRMTGMATIFLVVGKLFLVDLSQLQAIWRILLFIGFGAVFLLLGYYWQLKWDDREPGEGTKREKMI